jgi:hypothetical protein
MGTHFRLSNIFPENRGFYAIMWENYSTAKQATADNVVWSVRIAWWMTTATDPHSEYVIVIIFFMATVVTRTHLDVALYLHWLSSSYMRISTVIYFVVARMAHWQHILGFFCIILIMFVIHIVALFNDAFNISHCAVHNDVMVWIGMNGCEGRRREPDVSVWPGICCEILRQN